MFHAGAKPPTPEALMRARYSAYATGRARYIMATTDPDGPQHEPDAAAWRASIEGFCASTRFVGLEVLAAPPPTGDEGWVTFRAVLEQGGADASFVERSRFTRRAKRWLYHSGVPEEG